MAKRRAAWLESWAERRDRRKGWDKEPRVVGLLMLKGIQDKLRRENLYDTGSVASGAQPGPEPSPAQLSVRSLDGTYNDLDTPAMGSVGSRFGRNVPPAGVFPEPDERMLTPDPRVVSRELLTRETFTPATSLNVLAAAWIQFEVHDWFSHGKPDWDTPWELALRDGDDWFEDPMRIPRARRDPSWSDDGGPPTFVTNDSHWWDASQVYGTTAEIAAALRTGEGGKVRVDQDGLPPADVDPLMDLSDVPGNSWVGLAVLHGLFMREHNAICDRLRQAYPDWSDERLYGKARLVNAALMAKIHTIEWTPAIIAHPTSQQAMRVDWYGFVGEKVVRRLGRTRFDLLTGVPGSSKDHHGVPYSLTEEFTAVYRLHPLIPDDYTFRSAADGRVLAEHAFDDLTANHVRERLAEVDATDTFLSLGVANPGAVQLHNFPKALQTFRRPDGKVIDLAATDVLRMRERGVPRYNDFREAFHKDRIRSFDGLTPNRQWQDELRSVYADVDEVDLMVGLYAEPPPAGFGFSDTAFRVFALMAPRRLKSDRFFTTDYTPKMYTPEGIDWIDRTTMVSVLLRHHPGLATRLRGVRNAFAPWPR
jgi:hypothetical protein